MVKTLIDSIKFVLITFLIIIVILVAGGISSFYASGQQCEYGGLWASTHYFNCGLSEFLSMSAWTSPLNLLYHQPLGLVVGLFFIIFIVFIIKAISNKIQKNI